MLLKGAGAICPLPATTWFTCTLPRACRFADFIQDLLPSAKKIAGRQRNHPALADKVLLVSNGEQIAAFRLPLVNR
jgi:hypothetical protein